jgi:molybdate transport system substrate-binding protein
MIVRPMGAMAFAAAFAFLTHLPDSARAADVRVLVANNMKPTLDDFAGPLQAKTGHRLVLTPDSLAAVRDRVLAGETFDVAVTLGSLLDELAAQGKAARDARGDMARTSLVLYVRAGAAKPAIADADALRRVLLAAPSLAYAEDAVGTPVALLFPALLERLGIADAVRAKSKRVPLGGGFALVARGEVALGIAQTFDFVPPLGPPLGVDLVGPLPEDAAGEIVMAAAALAAARDPEAARSVVAYLTSAAREPFVRAHGMEP